MALGQEVHGVGRVVGPGQSEFHVLSDQPRVVRHAPPHHLQTVCFWSQAIGRLHGVVGRDHEPHGIEPVMGQHVLGDDEVPGVDGVE